LFLACKIILHGAVASDVTVRDNIVGSDTVLAGRRTGRCRTLIRRHKALHSHSPVHIPGELNCCTVCKKATYTVWQLREATSIQWLPVNSSHDQLVTRSSRHIV